MGQAFNLAGARTVLATNWNVNDTAAGDLATSLAEGLGNGTSVSKALRESKLTLIRELESSKRYPSPYYWAATTLLGDPKPLK